MLENNSDLELEKNKRFRKFSIIFFVLAVLVFLTMFLMPIENENIFLFIPIYGSGILAILGVIFGILGLSSRVNNIDYMRSHSINTSINLIKLGFLLLIFVIILSVSFSLFDFWIDYIFSILITLTAWIMVIKGIFLSNSRIKAYSFIALGLCLQFIISIIYGANCISYDDHWVYELIAFIPLVHISIGLIYAIDSYIRNKKMSLPNHNG